MLQFIKILDDSSGVTFNGNAPFIHWFDGPRSVNIWHYHRLLILGPEEFDVRFDDDSIFSFYNSEIDQDETGEMIDGFDWGNMNDSDGNPRYIIKNMTSTGIEYGDRYIHQIIILAKGTDDGEYIDTMIASSNGHDHEYRIGIELFGQDETLGINLSNMGIEIPDAIVKALYSSDLFEDYTDWILINRKWRELLSNYMDIWGCKGNYKSLINSLKWFEYGDLVELREVWKHGTNGGCKLSDKPISQWLTEELSKESSYNAKTTYFVLRHFPKDLNEEPERIPGSPYIEETGGEIAENFTVPLYPDKIYNIACKWEWEELRMKMALLGNFFETYFMPVHLDIIRSVIEDIYFNISAAIIYGAYEALNDDISSDIGNFDIKIGDDEWDSSTSVNMGTFNMDSYNLSVNTGIFKTSGDEEPIEASLNGSSKYTCAIIPIHIRFPESPISAYIETNLNGSYQHVEGIMKRSSSNELDLSIMARNGGKFYIILHFMGQNNRNYIKRIDFEVHDNINAVLSFFKLVFDYEKFQYSNPFSIIPTALPSAYQYNGSSIPSIYLNMFDNRKYLPFRESEYILTPDQPRQLRKYAFSGNVGLQTLNEKLKVSTIKEFSLLIQDGLKCWCKVKQNNTNITSIEIIGKNAVVDEESELFNILIDLFGNPSTSEKYYPEYHNFVQITAGEILDIYPIICIPMLYINTESGTERISWPANIDMKINDWIFKPEDEIKILIELGGEETEEESEEEKLYNHYIVSLNYKRNDIDYTITNKTPFIISSDNAIMNQNYKSWFQMSDVDSLAEKAEIDQDIKKKIYYKI